MQGMKIQHTYTLCQAQRSHMNQDWLKYNPFTLAYYKNVVIQLTSTGYNSFIPFVITTQDFPEHE